MASFLALLLAKILPWESLQHEQSLLDIHSEVDNTDCSVKDREVKRNRAEKC